jgi:PAS domain S-box-containing protein
MPFDTKPQDSFTFVTDRNGDFVSLSPAVYYVLGYAPGELLGRSFASLAAKDSFGRSSAVMYQLLQGRQSFRGMEIGLARSDGRTFETEISGRPVVETGQFRGYQGVVLAVSEYLFPAEVPVVTERETGLILDLVCHDIQNINQAQIWYLELILGNLAPDSPSYGYIQKCRELVTGSSDLLRNAQKLHRISSGTRTLEKVDIESVLSESMGQLPGNPGRDVKINLTIGEACTVMANALLKDTFINIIGNAIKHSSGPLVVDVIAEKIVLGSAKYCQVTVEDNGPGIPDAIKRHLFYRFDRGDAGGKGIGLFLVRKLVEGYGGKVQVEDRVPGDYRQGCRFIVLLPLADT